MRLFKTNRSERNDALADIGRYVVETSLSSFPETCFRVFGLTGPETCHNVVVEHTKASPYTITRVTVQRNDKKGRPVSVQFHWNGIHFPKELVAAVKNAFDGFFPMEASK